MRVHPLFLAAITTTCVAWAAPARAQIYTWRDPQGNLVLSDHKPGSSAPVQTFEVPQAAEVRTTRPVAVTSASRARQYDDLIEQHAQDHGVRADLVRAVMQVESAFNQYARSPKGALGLMQLMPATIRQFGVSNPFNPGENIRAGVAYLRQLLDRFNNNEQLALAAYNAGPGAVEKYGTTVPPYRETKQYVSKIGRIAGQAEPVAGTKLYRTIDIVDGHPVVKYTDKKPN
jgi:soluble lytic murein transglycosylase-like protein